MSSDGRAFRSASLVTPFSPEDWCEIGSRVPAILGVRVAPAGDEPRTGSNNSERVSTSGRSTNYGSGHLTRVFRDIGRISSLPFLLAHPSPIGAPAEREGSKTETEYGFARGKKWFQLCFVRNSPRWPSRPRVIRQNENPRSRELNGAGTVCRHRLARPGRYRAFAPVNRLIDPGDAPDHWCKMTRTELIIQLLKVAIGLAFGAYFVWWSLEVLDRLTPESDTPAALVGHIFGAKAAPVGSSWSLTP